jgi:hypothetical protein
MVSRNFSRSADAIRDSLHSLSSSAIELWRGERGQGEYVLLMLGVGWGTRGPKLRGLLCVAKCEAFF